jgi:hypothetical protein
MNAAQPVEEGNPQGVSGVVDVAGHYVVVAIDFHESRIYLLDGGGVSRPEKVVPSDPRGYHRHLHTKAGTLQGWYDPDDVEVWRSLAEQLRGATAVLLLGHGNGKANASHQFIAYVEKHDRELAPTLLGDLRVDVDDLTDAQIVRLGQQFFDMAPKRNNPQI